MTTARVLSIAFAILAAVMLGGAMLVTIAPHPVLESIGRAVYRLTCHARGERSLLLGGEPMAICARCSGIWAGMFLGSVLAGLGVARRPRITARVMFLIALPLIVDGVSQATGLRESNNVLRLLTGFPVGLGGIVWALQYAATIPSRPAAGAVNAS